MRLVNAVWTLWVLGILFTLATAEEEIHHREKRQFTIPGGFQGGQQQLFGGTPTQGLLPGTSSGTQNFNSNVPQRFAKDPVTGQFVAVSNVPTGTQTPIGPTEAADILSQAFEQIPLLAQKTGGNDTLLPGTRAFQVAQGLPDLMYQQCRTPKNEFGRCRHLNYCILPEFANNYPVFLQYACIIERRYVGVCCPRPAPQPTPSQPSTPSRPAPQPTPTQPSTPSRPPPSQQQSSGPDFGCGTSARTQTRIVGGQPTLVGEHPWIVSILRTAVNPNQYCGGVLLSTRHVLTAAHCLAGFDWSTIWVRIGEHDFRRNDESQHVQRRIANFKLHPNFNSRTFENDVALLILERPVQYSDYIRPICLPPANKLFTRERATVVGWGTLSYQGPVSPVLQKVTLPVWSNQDCDDAYDQSIKDTMICAGNPEGGQDSCQDDSGGPLMVTENNKWHVIGLVSFGTRCAEPNSPGVYTRVNKFLDWIRNNA